MSRRVATLAIAAAFMIPAIGLAVQAPWAVKIWPFETGRLTYMFLGSMIAAVVAAGAYVVYLRDWGATAGGMLNILVAFGGFALFLAWLALGGAPGLVVYVLVCTVVAIAAAAGLPWARNEPFADLRPQPRLVRGSFVVFAIVLLGAGAGLLLGRAGIMPWPLDPNTSVMIGTIFVADATYFLFGLYRPVWSNARGQLLAFLAYDVFLIVPLVRHFGTVAPELRANLTVYVAVVAYSAALATYYLLIHRQWRLFGAPGQETP
jgi:hypothetical protein